MFKCERCERELTEDIGYCESCVKSLERERKDKEEIVDTQRKVSNMLNRINSSVAIKQFVECESRDHRTLQQEFTKLCVAWLQHLASLPENYYDLRNEASVMLAKKLLANVDKYDLHLPLI